MKIRNGFVSNSSSSSFIIQGQRLSDAQFQLLEISEKEDDWDGWIMEINEGSLFFHTHMDNFDLKQYLISVLHIEPHLITNIN